MQVWNVLHAARWKCRTHKIARNSPSGHRRTNLTGYIFATKARINNQQKIVKQQYLPHMSSQYGELRPTSGWDQFVIVWGTTANFNGFRLLQHRRSTEANQTLHHVWPSPALVHYTPCLKKRPTFDLLYLWCTWMIFIGRNATDKVDNQKTFYYATSNNCASALPVKIGKHENHIFHSNGLCYIHTMHLCAVFVEEKNAICDVFDSV